MHIRYYRFHKCSGYSIIKLRDNGEPFNLMSDRTNLLLDPHFNARERQDWENCRLI